MVAISSSCEATSQPRRRPRRSDSHGTSQRIDHRRPDELERVGQAGERQQPDGAEVDAAVGHPHAQRLAGQRQRQAGREAEQQHDQHARAQVDRQRFPEGGWCGRSRCHFMRLGSVVYCGLVWGFAGLLSTGGFSYAGEARSPRTMPHAAQVPTIAVDAADDLPRSNGSLASRSRRLGGSGADPGDGHPHRARLCLQYVQRRAQGLPREVRREDRSRSQRGLEARAGLDRRQQLKPAQRLDWRKKLTAAQRHWVQFRQADCAEPVGYEWFGGTGMGGAVSTCIAKHTLDRIRHLEARYLDRK